MDVAVTELDLRGVNRGVVYFDRLVGATHCGARGFGVGFERIVVSAELFVLLTRHDALLDECSITLDLIAAPVLTRDLTREICFRLFLRSGVFGKICFRLFQICIEWPRIDREK